MSRGVTCSTCGASTPLPDDLRIPSFECDFCKATLATAAFAGRDVVSADEMSGYLKNLVEHGAEGAGKAAPHFEQHNDATRPAKCVHCGGAIAVPLDLRAKTVDCPSCKRTEPVRVYISDADRFIGDIARQQAGNQALTKLRAEGVACGKCGGHNAVTDAAAVQVICAFCSATILLSDYVGSDAVARARLKHGMADVRAAMVNAEKRRNRIGLIVALIVGVVALVTAAVMIVLHPGTPAPAPASRTGRHHS